MPVVDHDSAAELERVNTATWLHATLGKGDLTIVGRFVRRSIRRLS